MVLERKKYYNSYSKKLYTSMMKSNKINQNDSDYVNSKKGIFFISTENVNFTPVQDILVSFCKLKTHCYLSDITSTNQWMVNHIVKADTSTTIYFHF